MKCVDSIPTFVMQSSRQKAQVKHTLKKSKSENTDQSTTSETQMGNDGKPIQKVGSNPIFLGIGILMLVIGLGSIFVVGGRFFVMMAIVGLVLVAKGME